MEAVGEGGGESELEREVGSWTDGLRGAVFSVLGLVLGTESILMMAGPAMSLEMM